MAWNSEKKINNLKNKRNVGGDLGEHTGLNIPGCNSTAESWLGELATYEMTSAMVLMVVLELKLKLWKLICLSR